MLVLEDLVGLHRTIQLQLLQHYWWGIDLDYCDIEWFALETNRDHSVFFEIDSTHGHHQMLNTEIRWIIFFAAKDGEALYSQQKQDWELTVAQIMNPLVTDSDFNRRK